MNQSPLISVIVPIYNAEKYLDRCIQSITAQTYKKLEIILVDDGSPDNCPAICDAWASKDTRIISIHQKNQGVSAARNYGLMIATGKYMMFCDADDWIDDDYVEVLVNNIGNHQAIISSFQQNVEDGLERRDYIEVHDNFYSRDKFLDDCAKNLIYTYTVWGKLINRELIGDNRFSPIAYSEDAIFIRTILAGCASAVFVDSRGYHYWINQNGVTSDNSRTEEKSAGELILNCYTLNLCKKHKCNQLCAIFEKKTMNALLGYLKTAIKNPIRNPKQSKETVNNAIRLIPNSNNLFRVKLILLMTVYNIKCNLCPKISVH